MSDFLPRLGRTLGKIVGEFLAEVEKAQKPFQEVVDTVRESLRI